MKDYVNIQWDGIAAIITWKVICNWFNFFVLLQFIRESTVTETFIDMTTNVSTVTMDYCLVQLTTSTNDIQPKLIHVSWWSGLTLTDNDFVYTNTSTWANSAETSVIRTEWSWIVLMHWN